MSSCEARRCSSVSRATGLLGFASVFTFHLRSSGPYLEHRPYQVYLNTCYIYSVVIVRACVSILDLCMCEVRVCIGKQVCANEHPLKVLRS